MLPVHLLALLGVIISTVWADKIAFQWMRGSVQSLPQKTIGRLHTAVWAFLSLMIVSGVLMFYPRREFLLAEPLFLVKMLFVVILVANGILIGRLMGVTQKPYASLSKEEKMPLFISGAVSVLGWVGAIISALIVFAD